MKIEIVCGFVIRGDTETVYKYLLKCDTWPTNEEIMIATGIKNLRRVRNAVGVIKQQARLAEGRKKYFSSTSKEQYLSFYKQKDKSHNA